MTDEQQVGEVLSQYVRATDARDGDALAASFVPDGRVKIFAGPGSGQAADLEPLATLDGATAIGAAVASMMGEHAAGAWTHHVTTSPLVSVDGDRAELDMQFIRFDVQGDPEPTTGWAAAPLGPHGSVTPTEAGYYHATLTRDDDGWRITELRIAHSLPFGLGATR